MPLLNEYKNTLRTRQAHDKNVTRTHLLVVLLDDLDAVPGAVVESTRRDDAQRQHTVAQVDPRTRVAVVQVDADEVSDAATAAERTIVEERAVGVGGGELEADPPVNELLC